MIAEPFSLSSVVVLAAGAGVVHTLVGPDHYLPLAAVARGRRWGFGRLCAVTAALGLLHCLTSVVLVFGVVVAGGQLDLMASAAAWLMIGTGVCLGLQWYRRHRRAPWNRREGASTARRPRSRIVPVLIGLAFLIGPCEWLIPVAGATIAAAGPYAGLVVCAVFALCTVGTMVLAVTAVAFGFTFVTQRHSAMVGGLACTGCGVLMLAGF